MSGEIFERAMSLAECICAALTDEARGEDVWAGDCCVWPGGNVPWDNCCEGRGQAWVSILTGAPKAGPATPNCITGSQDVIYEIGAIRCVGLGLNCDCDCMEIGARRVMGDLEAIIKAVACCFDPDVCDMPNILSWETVRQAGCAGVKVRVSIGNDFSVCC